MRKGGVPVLKNMYAVAGNGPCNEELALRIQAEDKKRRGAARLTERGLPYRPGAGVHAVV